MDKQQLELRRLRYQMKAWMTKAILQMVQSGNEINPTEIDDLISNIASDALDLNSEIFQRSDVQQYISTINEVLDAVILLIFDRKLMPSSLEAVSPHLGNIECP